MARVLTFRPRGVVPEGQPKAGKQKNGRIRRFLDVTSERIFHRWMMRNQDERELAREYEVRRVEIEYGIREHIRRLLYGPEMEQA